MASIGTNNNKVLIINQDNNVNSNTLNSLNCLITDDQTIANQTPNYNAICEFRSANQDQAILMPSVTTANANMMMNATAGMFYYNPDVKQHVSVIEGANSTVVHNTVVTQDPTSGVTVVDSLLANNIFIQQTGALVFNGTFVTNSTQLLANPDAVNVSITLPVNNGTSGYFLSTDGNGHTSWSIGDGTGTVTNIATGTGLTGGPIHTTGTISLANTAVTPATYNFATLTVDQQGRLIAASTGTPVTSIIAGTNLTGGTITSTGTIALSATPSVTSITIANAPVTNTDGVNKQYADALIAGLSFKNPCAAASTVNLSVTYTNPDGPLISTVNGAFVIDGYTTALNDRILIKNQTASLQNGIYTVSVVGDGSTPWQLTRAIDYNTPAEITAGSITFITNGTVNANTSWIETSTVTTIGTDAITFSQFSYGPSTFLQAANNLSDVVNKPTAVSNLGLSRATLSNTLNTAVVGYVPFFNNATGTDLTYGGAGASTIFSNANGTLTITSSVVELASLSGTTSNPGALQLGGSLKFSKNSNIITLRADASLSSTYSLTLPDTHGTTGQVLTTSGSTGILNWTTPPAIITGSDVLTGTTGTVISSGAVTTSSTITVTRNIGIDDLTAVDLLTTGNIIVGSIVDGMSFTVYSTVLNDVGAFNWSIINA